jgi:hypothetical protein
MHVDDPPRPVQFRRHDRPCRIGGSAESQRGRMKGPLGPFIVCHGTEEWRRMEAWSA